MSDPFLSNLTNAERRAYKRGYERGHHDATIEAGRDPLLRDDEPEPWIPGVTYGKEVHE